MSMNKRNETGQFLPGKSGNPTGRPVTESTEIRKQLAAHASKVIEVIANAALGGDLQACKMILDRITPPLKAQTATIFVDVPASTNLTQKAEAFIQAAFEGSLAPDIAVQMVSAMSHLAHISDINELANRFAELEKSIIERNF